MPLVVQRSLFFTLEEVRYEEPATEAVRALAWPFFFFFFGLRTVFVTRSDRRRKESKQTPVFVRSLDGRKQKKKSSSALDTHSKIDQTQGRASRAIDRAPAPERPRLRYDLRNRRPGSPCKTQHGEHARPLSILAPGAVVRVQHPRTKRWDTSADVIEQKPSGRSYAVKTEIGRVYWRNRRFLRLYLVS